MISAHWVRSACREISKPLVPLGKAAVLLVKILKLLCKGMVSPARPPLDAITSAATNSEGQQLYFLLPQTPKKVGAMWVGAGLNWNDFLPEDQDMNKFVTEQVSRRSETPLSGCDQLS